MATNLAPEPPGYVVAPGFVKSNPLNNDAYVEMWKGDRWYPAIKNCHAQISKVVPTYNIVQIKDKFGGLRYYYSLPSAEELEFPIGYIKNYEELYSYCERAVLAAEAWCDGYENAIQDMRDKGAKSSE